MGAESVGRQIDESFTLKKAMVEGTNTQGGFLVPEIWSSKFYDLILAQSTAISLCEQVEMTSDTLHMPKATGQSTAYVIADECDPITKSTPTFGQLTMHPKKFAAMIELSSEVMEDSNPSAMSIAMNRLATDMALKIDDEIYNGTGTASGFLGFRKDTTVQHQDIDGELTLDNLVDAVDALACENINQNLALIVNPKVVTKLRKLKVSTTSNEPLLNLKTMGSPGLGVGSIGKIWSLDLEVISTTQLPANLTGTGTVTQNGSDALLVSRGKCGIFGNRRESRINTFYQIANDSTLLQINSRKAFTVNYPKAVNVLKMIKTD